jgi:hypothetical protein
MLQNRIIFYELIPFYDRQHHTAQHQAIVTWFDGFSSSSSKNGKNVLLLNWNFLRLFIEEGSQRFVSFVSFLANFLINNQFFTDLWFLFWKFFCG